jgi:hypothetical protein
MIKPSRRTLRRTASLRRLLRRVVPPLAVLALVVTLLGRAFLPYSSPVRSAFRFNADKFAYYMRGTGPPRDAWLERRPDRLPFPLNASAPGGDVAITIKSSYGTRDRLRPQLEALGLVSKQWVYAQNAKKMDATVRDDLFVVVADWAPPEGQRFDGIEIYDGVARTVDQLSPRLHNSPRLVKYRNLQAAIAAGHDEQALTYAYSFGWELDPEKVRRGGASRGLRVCAGPH